MAKNNIKFAKAHLRLLGYIQKQSAPYHWYHIPHNHSPEVRYIYGKWKSRDKKLTEILEKLTIRPKRHRNKQLCTCEAMIRMIGGHYIRPGLNMWEIQDQKLWYNRTINKWFDTSPHYNNVVHKLVKMLNREMTK